MTKKWVQNVGESQQYYIEDNHEAITEPWIWESVQYSERYKMKGTLECGNRHIYEETLIEIYLMAWNRLLECRDLLMP